MGLTIRRATGEDRSLLIAFHHALYVDHRGALVPRELEPLYAYRDLPSALRDDVDSLLSRPEAVVLVAERGGEPVGYATGHLETDPRRVLSRRGVVEDWFVEEGARGEGVGRALLEALIDVFREAGCDVVESTTFADNAGARDAHAALGFREIEVKMRMELGD